MTATNNNTAAAVNIICRINVGNKEPIVFLTDSIDYVKETIDAQVGPKLNKVENVPMSVYRTSQPVSEADEKFISELFMKSTGTKSVDIRHKLPRRHQKAMPSILTANNETPVPAANDMPQLAGADAVRAEIIRIGNELDDRLQKLLAMLPKAA